jgi:hypothetical protein
MITKMRFSALFLMVLLSTLLASYRFIPVQGMNSFAISWSHVILPLMGALLGALGSYLLIIRSILLLLAMAIGFKTQVFFGLPTLFASLYWSTESGLLRVGIPLLCMILFICHPIGFYAAPYTLFWLIPIGAYFYTDSRLLTAMASTFTAHAVGSIMHLYMIGTLSSSVWLGLIPVVMIERLVLGLSMYVAYKLLIKLRALAYKNGYGLLSL